MVLLSGRFLDSCEMASVKVAVRVRPINKRYHCALCVVFLCHLDIMSSCHDLFATRFIYNFILSSIVTFRERDLGAKMIIEMEGKKTRIVNIKVTALQHYRAEKLAA